MKQGAVYGQTLTILSIPEFPKQESLAQIKGDERRMTTKYYKGAEIQSWSRKTHSI